VKVLATTTAVRAGVAVTTFKTATHAKAQADSTFTSMELSIGSPVELVEGKADMMAHVESVTGLAQSSLTARNVVVRGISQRAPKMVMRTMDVILWILMIVIVTDLRAKMFRVGCLTGVCITCCTFAALALRSVLKNENGLILNSSTCPLLPTLFTNVSF
jgi:hypothetical protein